jgi:GNAT superfamily N-acetyltransferase
MQVAVRRLAAGDNTCEAARLLTRFFEEEGFDTPADTIWKRTAEMARIDACGLFVAETEGQAIGVATVSCEFGIEFGWSAEMGDLYVVPEWRGRGIATLLLEAAEHFLAARGGTGYQVTVTPFGQDHHDLKAFYAKLGFASEGRLILRKSL